MSPSQWPSCSAFAPGSPRRLPAPGRTRSSRPRKWAAWGDSTTCSPTSPTNGLLTGSGGVSAGAPENLRVCNRQAQHLGRFAGARGAGPLRPMPLAMLSPTSTSTDLLLLQVSPGWWRSGVAVAARFWPSRHRLRSALAGHSGQKGLRNWQMAGVSRDAAILAARLQRLAAEWILPCHDASDDPPGVTSSTCSTGPFKG